MAVRKILKEVIEHLKTQGTVRVDQAPYWIAQLEHAENLNAERDASVEARLQNLEQRIGFTYQPEEDANETQ